MPVNPVGAKRWRLPAYAAETLLLVFFVLAVYAQSVGFSFVGYDDPVVIINNDSIRDIYSLEGIWNVLKPESRDGLHEWMPLKNLSLALDCAVLGNSAASFRLQTLLWYVLCVIAFHRFLALFLEILAGRGVLDWDRCTRRLAALFAALLFAAHPVHVQSVAWLSSRKDLLMMTFFFAGLYHQVYSYSGGQKRSAARASAAMLFYVLALLSKPSAVGFPLMIVVIDAIFEKEPGLVKFIRKRLFLYAAYFVLTLAYSIAYLKIAAGPSGLGLENVAEGAVEFNGTLLQLIGQQLSAYVVWAVWPVKLLHYPLFELSESYLSAKVLAGLACAVLLIVSLLYASRRLPLAALATGLFVAGLLPVIGQAPFKQYYEVRYLLISVAAPALLVAWAFVFIRRAGMKLAAFSLVTAVLCFWTVLTLRDMQAWSSTEALWLDSLAKEPRLWVAHSNLGKVYAQKGLLEKADTHAGACMALNPESEECISIKAMTTYYSAGPEAALKLLENSMQFNRSGKITDNIALIYLKQGRKQEALEFYARNIEGRKVYASDLAHYAAFLLSAGEPVKALEVYRKAQLIRENGAYDYASEIEKVSGIIRAKAAEEAGNEKPAPGIIETVPAPEPPSEN